MCQDFQERDLNKTIARKLFSDLRGLGRLIDDFGVLAIDEVVNEWLWRGLMGVIPEEELEQYLEGEASLQKAKVWSWDYFRPILQQEAERKQMQAQGLRPGDILSAHHRTSAKAKEYA